MLDLSTIRFAVDTSALDVAVTKVAALGAAIQGLAGSFNVLEKAATSASKTQAETNTEASKTVTVADKITKATEGTTEAVKAATEASKAKAKADMDASDASEGLSKTLARNITITKEMADGYSRGQASIIATAKAAGDAAEELKALRTELEKQRAMQGTDPFDKSMGAMKLFQNELRVTNTVQELYNRELGLTKGQMEALGREHVRLTEQFKIQGKAAEGVAAEFEKTVQAAKDVALAQNGIVNSMKSSEDAINKAATANAYLERELQKVRNAMDASNTEMSRGTVNSITRFDNALKASGKTLSEQTVLLNEYKTAQLSLQKASASRNADYITRAVAPQITDIVVGLATGQNPLTVMLQQGGQLRDQMALARVEGAEMANVMRNAMSGMAKSVADTGKAIGSMLVSGLIDASKATINFVSELTGFNTLVSKVNTNIALAGVAAESSGNKMKIAIISGITSLLAGIGTLTTILTAGGILAFIASVVSLGVAFFQVAKENDELVKALTLTGGGLALTQTHALNYIHALTAVGATTGEATQVLIAMAKAGNLASSDIMMIGEAASEMSKWTGVAIEETVKQFSKLKDKPVEAAIELARATGLISPSILKNIEDLERQGKHLEAGGLAMSTYANITKTQLNEMKDNYTTFYATLIKMKDTVASFFSDTFKSVMIAKDPITVLTAQVNQYSTALDNMQKANKLTPDTYSAAEIEAGKDKLDNLREQLSLTKKATGYAELQIAKNKQSADAEEYYNKLRESHQTKEVKAQQEIDRIRGRMEQDATNGVLTDRNRLAALGAIQKLQEQIDGRPRSASSSLGVNHSNEITVMERMYNLEEAAQTKALANQLKNAKLMYESGNIDKATYFKKEIDILTTAYATEEELSDKALSDRTALYFKETETLAKAYEDRLQYNSGRKHSAEEDAKLTKSYIQDLDNANRALGLFTEKVKAKNAAFLDNINTKENESLKEIAGNLEKARLAMVSYNEATRHRNELIDEGIANQDKLRYATPEEAAIIKANAEAVKYYSNELSKLNKEKAEAERALQIVKDANYAPDSKQMETANNRVLENAKNINQVIADQKLGIDKAGTDAHATYYKDVFKEVADVISGSITEALFNGGASGTKMLRDYILKVLKQKFTLELEVSLVKPAMDYAASFLGLPSSSGSASGNGLLGGIGGVINNISTAKNALSTYSAASNYFPGIGQAISNGGNVLTGAVGGYEGSLYSGTLSDSGMALYGGASAIEGGSVAAGSVAAASQTTALYGGITEGAAAASASASAAFSSALAAVPVWGWVALALSTQLGGPEITPIGDGLSGTLSAKGSSLSNRTDYKEDNHGLFGMGSFTTMNSVYSKASDGVTTYVDMAVATVTKATKSYADAIGLSATSIDDFSKQIDITLTGLNATQRQAEIDKAITGFIDSMVTSAYDTTLKLFAKEGETSSTTLKRLALDMMAINKAVSFTPWEGLKNLSLSATEGLITLSGGLDKLLGSLGTFYTKFYTQGEQAARNTSLLSNSFKELGITMPSVDGNMRLWYRSVVEQAMALDQSVPANNQAVLSILALQDAVDTLAPAFDNVLTSTKDAALAQSNLQQATALAAAELQKQQAIETEGNNLQKTWLQLIGDNVSIRSQELAKINDVNKALQLQIWAYQDAQAAITSTAQASDKALSNLQTTITAQSNIISTIKSVFDTLQAEVVKLYQGVSLLSTNTTAAQTVIDTAIADAKNGVLPDQNTIIKASTDIQSTFGSATSQFESDRNRLVLAGQLSQLSGLAGTQLTEAQKQLQLTNDTYKVAKQQLDALRGISENVMSVSDAVEAFQVAFTGEATARQKLEALKNPSGSKTSASSPNDTLNSNAAFEIVYNNNQIANLQKQYTDGISSGGNMGALELIPAEIAALQAATQSNISLAQSSYEYTTGLASIASALASNTPTSVAIDTNRNTTVFDAVSSATLSSLPSFDIGTDYVPYDMVANIHKGEMIVPAAFNPSSLNPSIPLSNNSSDFNSDIVYELQSLRTEVKTLRENNDSAQQAIAINTLQVSKLAKRWDGDGLPPTRTTT
jgi:phage-related minor tail protein